MVVLPVGDVLPDVTNDEVLADSPLPTTEGLLADLLCAPVASRPLGVTGHRDRRSPSRVPRWRLAREGPFLSERSSSALGSFGAGCAFRNTTYRASDYLSPSGEFGIPLNHPRFLEWIGVPESASLLEMGPGRWLNALSRDKSYGGGHPVASGCVLDDHELGHSGPVCPRAAGYCFQDVGEEHQL